MVKKISPPIYLDYNATTPLEPEVVDIMSECLKLYFGNPSSSHLYGVQSKKVLETARSQVASLLKCSSDEIVFTSGGTESNNMAIKGAAFANKSKGNHIITSSIEHPAVLEVCCFLEQNGFKVTYLPVDKFGVVNPDDVKKAILPQTILITIMHANNETGSIQPIEQIAKIAKGKNILFHTDAAQSVGKIPVGVDVLGVDLLSVAGHKLHAPKGVGVLFVRKGTLLSQFTHGGNQEKRIRPGTENLSGIAGLGKACEMSEKNMAKNLHHMKEMRDILYQGLKATVNDLRLNGHPETRLPNTLSLSFKGLDANTLLAEVKDYVAASAGAACHSGTVELSSVLKAMNVSLIWGKGTVRFSVGRMTTKDDIEKVVDIFSAKILKEFNL